MSKSFDAFNSNHSQQCDQDHLLVEGSTKSSFVNFVNAYQRRGHDLSECGCGSLGDMIDELD